MSWAKEYTQLAQNPRAKVPPSHGARHEQSFAMSLALTGSGQAAAGAVVQGIILGLLEFEADKGARSASSFNPGQNWISIGPLEEQKPRSVGQWV